MSFDFNGTTSAITATITAMDTLPWTLLGWVNLDTMGEGGTGRLFSIEGGGAYRQIVRFGATNMFEAFQNHATAQANSKAVNNTLALGDWRCVAATYDTADSTCRLYHGTLIVPMGEVAYASQTAGTGARSTGGTSLQIGRESGGSETVDGRIGATVVDNRLWSLQEMEYFRRTSTPPMRDTLRAWYSFTGVSLDKSGRNANGGVSAAGAALDELSPGLLLPSRALATRWRA